MKYRIIAAALTIACVPVLTANECIAQGSDDTTTDVARSRFKEGVDFFDKGDFEHARASFLQAYALKKHPAVLLNLAWSCLKSGHALEAERYFKQFPVDGPEVTEKQRADAADGLGQAHAKLGRIDVIAPRGAEITVDGERAGLAPLAQAIWAEPGSRTVREKAPDGPGEVRNVMVLAGAQSAASFGAGSGAAVSPPAAVATAAPAVPVAHPEAAPDEPEPTAAAARDDAAVSATTNDTRTEKGFFPANSVPLIVGGLITLAATGVAIAMLQFRQDASDQADGTAANIRAAGQSCPAPAGATASLTNACATFANDNGEINLDATVGNIALGVAIVSFVGTTTYWVLSDKREYVSHTAKAPIVVPVVGRSMNGLSLSGEF